MEFLTRLAAAIDRFEDGPLAAALGVILLFGLTYLGLLLTGAK
jgi:hypothetical protein